ncbi:MAG TPA: hypothetical protein VG323_03475 [Thermoanaerobaculia bacterium]|nr:hypothetical protein [Thermoanaerobaculia bacterium]
MIVVVASAFDAAARSVVARWGSRRAAMLTAEDLCRPGWSLRIPVGGADTSVIAERVVPNAEIEGVLTLRPCVFPAELRSIRPVDRQYVSAELNAFLLGWLTSLRCPVVNRPSAASLAGPNWLPEKWAMAAASCGIPVRRETRPSSDDALEIIAAGDRCFGSETAVLGVWTRQLARTAGVDLLSVRYSRDHHFLSASCWPTLTDDEVLDAVRERVEQAQ